MREPFSCPASMRVMALPNGWKSIVEKLTGQQWPLIIKMLMKILCLGVKTVQGYTLKYLALLTRRFLTFHSAVSHDWDNKSQ
jgi:hypothetical protein